MNSMRLSSRVTKLIFSDTDLCVHFDSKHPELCHAPDIYSVIKYFKAATVLTLEFKSRKDSANIIYLEKHIKEANALEQLFEFMKDVNTLTFIGQTTASTMAFFVNATTDIVRIAFYGLTFSADDRTVETETFINAILLLATELSFDVSTDKKCTLTELLDCLAEKLRTPYLTSIECAVAKLNESDLLMAKQILPDILYAGSRCDIYVESCESGTETEIHEMGYSKAKLSVLGAELTRYTIELENMSKMNFLYKSHN